ncbi:MAG: YihY/virulence factor BrkB family protein [Actinomycetota bacterium]|nr:YihY/virulence factor BrkB family protein [Actinomycetota bacterium]
MEMPHWAGRARELGKALVGQVVRDRVTGLAAEVAFFGVLSVFPGLLMLAGALGSLEALVGSELARRSKEQVVGFLDLVLTDQAEGAIAAVEELFAGQSGGLVTVASLGALWGLSRGMAAVVRALNLAYDVEESRSWIRLRLLGVALAVGTVVMGALVLAMIVVGPLFGIGGRLAEVLGLGDAFVTLWSWVRWPVAFGLLVGWATTLLHIAPATGERTRWRGDLPGAVLASVLWLAVSLGFNVYLRVAGEANPVFGVLGGGLTLLVWLYLLSFALLLGGEVNGLLHGRRAGG